MKILKAALKWTQRLSNSREKLSNGRTTIPRACLSLLYSLYDTPRTSVLETVHLSPLRRIERPDAAEMPPLACKNFRGISSELGVASMELGESGGCAKNSQVMRLAVRIAIVNRETIYTRINANFPSNPSRLQIQRPHLLHFYVPWRTAFLLFVRLYVFSRDETRRQRGTYVIVERGTC